MPTRSPRSSAACTTTGVCARRSRLSAAILDDNKKRMRYLVTARLRPGKRDSLVDALEQQTLGAGSVAYGEYERNMADARVDDRGTVRWVEVCYCATPLEEERPYWNEYFELEHVQDAHARSRCRDASGEAPWSCGDCDCSARLEARLAAKGRPFLDTLRR